MDASLPWEMRSAVVIIRQRDACMDAWRHLDLCKDILYTNTEHAFLRFVFPTVIWGAQCNISDATIILRSTKFLDQCFGEALEFANILIRQLAGVLARFLRRAPTCQSFSASRRAESLLPQERKPAGLCRARMLLSSSMPSPAPSPEAAMAASWRRRGGDRPRKTHHLMSAPRVPHETECLRHHPGTLCPQLGV